MSRMGSRYCGGASFCIYDGGRMGTSWASPSPSPFPSACPCISRAPARPGSEGSRTSAIYLGTVADDYASGIENSRDSSGFARRCFRPRPALVLGGDGRAVGILRSQREARSTLSLRHRLGRRPIGGRGGCGGQCSSTAGDGCGDVVVFALATSASSPVAVDSSQAGLVVNGPVDVVGAVYQGVAAALVDVLVRGE